MGLALISPTLAVFMHSVPKGYPQSQRGEEFAVAGSKSPLRGDLVRVNREQLEGLTVLFSLLP